MANYVNTGLLPDEEQLLLWSATRLMGSDAPLPDHILDSVDWVRVLQVAYWHRLSPILYYFLSQESAFRELSPPESKFLAELHARSVAQSMLLKAQLSRILEQMRSRDLACIVLKGLPLEGDLYPQVGLRPMNDIDLMVDREALPEAEDVLNSLRFVQEADYELREEFRNHHHHLAPYYDRDTNVKVEMHWNLISPRYQHRIEVGDFWKRARTVSLDGIVCRVLSPEDQLLHLCVHFMGDRQSRKAGALLQICDIALHIARYEDRMDWEYLIERANSLALTPLIFTAFFATRTVTGVSCPDDVYEQLRPDGFDSNRASLFVRKRVLSSASEVPTTFVQALATPGIWGKVRQAIQALRPKKPWSPTDYRGRRGGASDGSRSSATYPKSSLYGNVKRVLFRPWSLWEQVLVERWITKYIKSTPSR